MPLSGRKVKSPEEMREKEEKITPLIMATMLAPLAHALRSDQYIYISIYMHNKIHIMNSHLLLVQLSVLFAITKVETKSYSHDVGGCSNLFAARHLFFTFFCGQLSKMVTIDLFFPNKNLFC